jgi:hypothetical protein
MNSMYNTFRFWVHFIAVILGIIGAFFISAHIVGIADVHAEEAENVAPVGIVEADDQGAPSTARGNVYTYTAQRRDSYTKIARKAVQTYGIREDVSLSPAQIIFAETNMTKEAGSPLLAIDQEVIINESTIIDWVKKSQELNEIAIDAWSAYVPFVDFNTDQVGESR